MSEDFEKEHRFWSHFGTDFKPLKGPEMLTIFQKDSLGTEKLHQKMELEEESSLQVLARRGRGVGHLRRRGGSTCFEAHVQSKSFKN